VATLSLLSLTPALAGDHAGGHGHGSVPIAADGTSACERSGYPGAAGGHGHRGPEEYETPSRAERARLMGQVAEADAAAARYPTVRTALAAGYEKVTGYLPCVAAHYFKRAALRSPFEPAEPEVLLFGGTAPDSRIVGLSYLELGNPATEPEGFAGTNDHWHVHPSFCLREGLILDPAVPIGAEECAAAAGRHQPAGNLWMLHMWNVPGWDSRWGLFSAEHPDLGIDEAAGVES
jgi:hypothetical protein